jgi:hypothetical protein
MNVFFTVFAFIILLFLGLYYIPAFMVRRAILKVINIFCRHDAIGVENAKTVDELGLKPLDFFQRLWRLRDYKPQALQILRQQGIVYLTKDGKLYIVEDELDENLKCKRTY